MMLVKSGPLGPPADRLLAAVARRGHDLFETIDAMPPCEDDLTVAIADGPMVLDLGAMFARLAGRRLRLLVLSRLGAHPDARAASLRRLWRLEEHARGLAPTLTLRCAPLVGPETPLWRKLRARPALPDGGRKLVNPVAEVDMIETIVRALAGRVRWNDWFEVAGPDTLSLAELRDLAARTNGPSGGDWEPPLDEIAEHRLAETEPWASTFGITPTPLAAWTGAKVA